MPFDVSRFDGFRRVKQIDCALRVVPARAWLFTTGTDSTEVPPTLGALMLLRIESTQILQSAGAEGKTSCSGKDALVKAKNVIEIGDTRSIDVVVRSQLAPITGLLLARLSGQMWAGR